MVTTEIEPGAPAPLRRVVTVHDRLESALSGQKPAEALKRCCDILLRDLGVDLVELWTVSANEPVLDRLVSAGVRHAPQDPARVPLASDAVLARCLREGISTVRVVPPCHESERWILREGTVNMIACPLVAGGEPAGVLAAYARAPIPADVGDELLLVRGLIAAAMERRRWATGLHTLTSLLAAIDELCPLAVVSIDADCRISFWNHAAEKLFGWTRAEVYGIGLPIIPENTSPHLLQIFDELLQGRVLWAHTSRKLDQKGQPVDVLVWTSPIQDSAGQFAGVLGLFAPTALIRHVDGRLDGHVDLAALGRLAGAAAAQINDTLTVIEGYSGLIEELTGHGTPAHEMAAQIRTAADRAADVARETLSVAQARCLAPEGADPREVLRELERDLQKVYGLHLTIQTEVDDDCGRVAAHPELVANLLMDLTARAASSCGPEAVVRIACHPAVMGTDAGAGGRQVYDLFEVCPQAPPRAVAPSEPASPSVGVPFEFGEAVARQCHGSLEVCGTPGGPPSFRLMLPRVASPPARRRLPAPATRPDAERAILVVEDDPQVRALLVAVLRKAGHRVLKAGSADEALALWSRDGDAVHLAILDVMLPDLDGARLAHRLLEERPDLRLLFISGYVEDAVARLGLLPAGTPFLHKPFDPRTLRARVNTILDSKVTAEDRPGDT